jgi:Flp pilus assembly protein TadG
MKLFINYSSSNIKSRRKGAALVEAAIVLPVFFMGIVEFGRGMLVTNGSREAARRCGVRWQHEYGC